MSGETDTFVQFGHAFQTKVITCMITDQTYLNTVADIMDKRYFESDATQWVVNDVLKYFQEFKIKPTWESVAVRLKQATLPESLVVSIRLMMKEAVMYENYDDLEFVKKTSLEFCKNQEIKNAMLESTDYLQRGDYEAIKTRMDRAFKAGLRKDIGHVWKDTLDARFDETARVTIATPWDVVNEIMDGGSGIGSTTGELYVMVAPPGIGKTWGLIAIGAHALKLGKNVLHYTMELSQVYVGRRYDANLSGISLQNLKYHKEDLRTTIANVPGNLIIKEYPTKTASLTTLRAHLDMLLLQGFHPDIIIVDYADLMKPHGGFKEVRHQIENIYEELRGLSGEYRLPIWTASQSNRSSVDAEVVEADMIAEAFAKIMISDFILSLSRKMQDKVSGTGRWYVMKNRFGPDGLTFPSRINTSTGQIQLFEATTPQGRDTKEHMKKGDIMLRKALKRRKDELEDRPSLDLKDDASESTDDKYGGFEGGTETE